MTGILQRVRLAAKRLRYRSWAGYCTVCQQRVRFLATGRWYRDELLCSNCYSIPRSRALLHVLSLLYPQWRSLKIHESSPGEGGASGRLSQDCRHYVASQFQPTLPLGQIDSAGVRNEDLTRQTFADESFDLVITQDVFEHLMEPGLAIAEIARTLKPGGAHVMTVPIVRKTEPSRRRAHVEGGEIVFDLLPEYHGNPVSNEGALVTVDWGYDLADYLAHHSGLPTMVFTVDDPSLGISGEYIDVVVTRKGAVPSI